MKQRLSETKDRLVEFLEEYLSGQAQQFDHVNGWSADTCDRLLDFASRGKMVRGSLVVLLAQAFGAGGDDAVRVGAAMELLQSGLLVHDDIMDGDEVRRGEQALHAQYADLHGERFGLGAGICVGDVAFFMAFDLLNECARARELVQVFSRETQSLGFGQMQDVYFGVADAEPSVEQILAVYKYKTGRYTFSLPFLLALVLADRLDQAGSFASLGEELGVVFQVRDDEIGLLGEEDEIGKPVGADIREDKKTLHRLELLRLAEGEDLEFLRSVFGTNVSREQVDRVRKLVERLGVSSAVRAHASVCEQRAQALLDDLQVPVEVRKVLEWLIAYNRHRDA